MNIGEALDDAFKEFLEALDSLNPDSDIRSSVPVLFIDYESFIDDEDTADEIIDKASEYIRENSDIIYYSNAMKFLSEHDPSLVESFEIADELGYRLKNLNSEILASLLNGRIAQEALSESEEYIREYHEEYMLAVENIRNTYNEEE